jgi:hypothetical protein
MYLLFSYFTKNKGPVNHELIILLFYKKYIYKTYYTRWNKYVILTANEHCKRNIEFDGMGGLSS